MVQENGHIDDCGNWEATHAIVNNQCIRRMLQKKMIDQEHIFLSNKYMQRIPSIPTKYYYCNKLALCSSFFFFFCLFVDDFNSFFHDKSHPARRRLSLD